MKRGREEGREREREKVGVIRNDQYFHLLNDGDRLTRVAHVSGDLWSSETDREGGEGGNHKEEERVDQKISIEKCY